MTNTRAITFEVNTEGVQEVFTAAPQVAYRHLRAFLFGSFIEHRLAWLARKGVKFGRPSKKGIVVPRVGDVSRENDRTVVYDVPPKKEASTPREAAQLLELMVAEIRTGNIVLPVHQFGGTTKSTKGMVLPQGTKQQTPRDFLAKYPRKRLVKLPMRDGSVGWYEAPRATRNAKTGRYRKRRNGKRPRLRLRFLVVKKVDNKPTLKFYEVWDRQASLRDAKWSDRATRMVADMQAARARG